MEDEVIFRIEVEGEEGATTIESITKASKALREERKKLDITTEDGKKRIQEINGQLDINNAKIKENVSGLEKQRLNVGNYTGALDKLVPGLGATANGFMSMVQSAKAFIATPIGLIIAALAAVVATLTAAIKTDDEAADEFGKRWDQISSIFDVVLRRVGALGKALINLAKGDLDAAFASAKDAVTGLGDELARAWTLSGELADRQNDLDDALNKFNATEKERLNNIKQLEIASKDATKTDQERIRLNQQAAALEDKLTKERTALVERQSAIDVEAIGLKHNLQKELNETTKQYGLRLLENSKIGGEEAKTISESLSKIDEAQSASVAKQEKLIAQRNKLLEDQKIAEAKAYEEAIKLSDEQFAADIQRIKDKIAAEQAVKQEARSLEEENIQIEQDAQEEVYIKDWKAYSEAEKMKSKIAKLEAQNRLSVISNTIGQAQALFKEDSVAYKVLGIARATIDTFRAANLAMSSYPPPFGQIAAAAAIATGLANVIKIANVKFHSGGVLQGASHAQGGIPFSVGGRLGFEAEGGEAIINKRSTAMFRPLLSRINQAGGGVRFAEGGIPSFGGVTIARASETLNLTREVFTAISRMRIAVAVDDINNGQQRVEVNDSRSNFF